MKIFKSLIMLFSMAFLSGCLGTQYLKQGQYLIYQQKIKGNKQTSSEELSELFRQKSNKRIPLIQVSPYIYFYQWGLKTYDTRKLEIKRDSVDNEFGRKIELAASNPKKRNRLTKKKNKRIEKIEKSMLEGNFLMRLGEPLA
ncbi:MAG TPA: hypothetical protein VI583_14980, partial [Cyclobacteriaceae bacterium]|nr:hypothetical protein [Cyclobacteriaceae bacterium]